MSAKLEVEALRWGAEGRPIVQGVSLTVEEGEFVGVIGPNGSGKSSLLRCIYRANRPQGGTVLLDGRDLWRMPVKEAARHAAAVPQEMPTQFEFTVREIVAMGRYPHKGPFSGADARDEELVERALDYVGMSPCADRTFASLSGGEKQRALIARAIAQDAGLLLLDEPTNHLDVYYQLEILDLIRSAGVSCLVVMHDLNLAAQHCARLYVMHDGCVVAGGRPRDVLTPELIRRVYRVEAEVTTAPGGAPHVLFLRALKPQGAEDRAPTLPFTGTRG